MYTICEEGGEALFAVSEKHLDYLNKVRCSRSLHCLWQEGRTSRSGKVSLGIKAKSLKPNEAYLLLRDIRHNGLKVKTTR